MVFVQQFVNAPNFVTVHDDFFAILGFHYVAGLHVGCATILVFHPHLAVFEDINRRAIFQLDDLFCCRPRLIRRNSYDASARSRSRITVAAARGDRSVPPRSPLFVNMPRCSKGFPGLTLRAGRRRSPGPAPSCRTMHPRPERPQAPSYRRNPRCAEGGWLLTSGHGLP